MVIRTPAELRQQMPIGVVGGSSAQDIHDIVDTFEDRTSQDVLAKTASYTAAAADNRRTLTFNAASNVTLTLPASLPVGWETRVVQLGAGKVSIVAGTGGALFSPNGTRTSTQYATVGVKVFANANGAAAQIVIWSQHLESASVAAVVDFADSFTVNNSFSNWSIVRQELSATVTWNSGGFARCTAPAFAGGSPPKGNLDLTNWNGQAEKGYVGDTVIAKQSLRLAQANTTDVFLIDVESRIASDQPGIRFRTKNGNFLALERDKLDISGQNVTSSYALAANTWYDTVLRLDLNSSPSGRTRLWAKTQSGSTWTLVIDSNGPNMPIPGTTAGVNADTTTYVDYYQVGITANGDTTQSIQLDVDNVDFKLYRGAAPASLNPA